MHRNPFLDDLLAPTPKVCKWYKSRCSFHSVLLRPTGLTPGLAWLSFASHWFCVISSPCHVLHADSSEPISCILWLFLWILLASHQRKPVSWLPYYLLFFSQEYMEIFGFTQWGFFPFCEEKRKIKTLHSNWHNV
jgi:hypothetical protein